MIHLWDFSRHYAASVCGKATYGTSTIVADPCAVTCAKCYLEWLRRKSAPEAAKS